MSLIQVRSLTFGYDGCTENVFDQVSFQFDTNWRLGLIGRNGRGKTTFLKLLSGEYPYQGTIRSDVQFLYFPYAAEDPAQISLEVMRQAHPQAEDWELIREAMFLDVDPELLYRPYQTLSHGEQTKILIAALFAVRDKFLLIDEPTNHLDAEGRKKIGEYLRGKNGFLLVSHDRTLLNLCTDHIISINKTSIEVLQGNFSVWWENHQRQEQFERSENQKLHREIRRLNASARRAADWSARTEERKNGVRNSGSKVDKGFVGHKSAKMMQRAKNQIKHTLALAEEKQSLLKDAETVESLKLTPLHYRSSVLAEASDLELKRGNRVLFSPLKFSVREGSRIALTGSNGCGKSTLLHLLASQCRDGGQQDESVTFAGSLRTGSGLIVSVVPQDASQLHGTVREIAEQRGLDETRMKTILRKMGMSRSELELRTESFSEGQKKKVLLTASLCEPAHLYIWDEPLNYIDVFTRMQIEDVILSSGMTMLFVEHDQAFREKTATETIHLGRSGIE